MLNTCNSCGYAASAVQPLGTESVCPRCQGKAIVMSGELSPEELAVEKAEQAKVELSKKRLEANKAEEVRLQKVKDLEDQRAKGLKVRSEALKDFRASLKKLDKTVTQDVLICDEGPAIRELVDLLLKVTTSP